MFTSLFQSIANIILLPTKAIGGMIKGLIYKEDDAKEVTIKANDTYEAKVDAVSQVASDVIVSSSAIVFLILFLLTRYVKPVKNFMIGNPLKKKKLTSTSEVS